MKRYKLLKDTLTVNAGAIFEEEGTIDDEKRLRLVQVTKDGCQFGPWIVIRDIINFDEWFEEIPEKHERWRGGMGDDYYFINDEGAIRREIDTDVGMDNYRYNVGIYGRTKQELEAKLKYNVARQVLLDDAEGGKWDEHGCNNWNAVYAHNNWGVLHFMSYMPGLIYFQDKETLEKSLEEHKDQWEIVREYEMRKK